jgi:hypothetical protein
MIPRAQKRIGLVLLIVLVIGLAGSSAMAQPTARHPGGWHSSPSHSYAWSHHSHRTPWRPTWSYPWYPTWNHPWRPTWNYPPRYPYWPYPVPYPYHRPVEVVW